jgi:uncharacterized protein (DUF983 family)
MEPEGIKESAGDYSIPAVRRAAYGRALRKRCPQCGQGKLFLGYARLAAGCNSCKLIYRREQGSMTGSMYLTAVVTEVVAVFMIGLAWIFTDWTAPVFIAVSVPSMLLFSAWLLPVSQAIWVGVEYSTDAGNRENWVRPVL